MPTILAVDDDADMRLLYEHIVRGAGHTFCCAWTAMGALELIRTEPVDLVLLDLELGGLMSGIDVMRHVPPRIPVVIVTGHECVYWRERDDNPEHPLFRAKAALFKPVTSADILAAIDRYAGGPAA